VGLYRSCRTCILERQARSNDFGYAMVRHMRVMMVSRLISMLVLGHVVVVHDGRLRRQSALIWGLMFGVWWGWRRQGALVCLRVDGEGVLVFVDEALRAVVFDGTGRDRVELVVGDRRATFNRHTVELVDFFLASGS